MKGNATCHCPNDDYRDGWDRIWGTKKREEKCATTDANGFGSTQLAETMDVNSPMEHSALVHSSIAKLVGKK